MIFVERVLATGRYRDLLKIISVDVLSFSSYTVGGLLVGVFNRG